MVWALTLAVRTVLLLLCGVLADRVKKNRLTKRTRTLLSQMMGYVCLCPFLRLLACL